MSNDSNRFKVVRTNNGRDILMSGATVAIDILESGATVAIDILVSGCEGFKHKKFKHVTIRRCKTYFVAT